MLPAPTAWRLIAPDLGVDVELPLGEELLAVVSAPSDRTPPWAAKVGAIFDGAAEARAMNALSVLFV